MSSGKSTFLQNRELNYLFNGGPAVVVPASIFVRFYTTALTPGGVGTEVAAPSYDPAEFARTAANFPVAADGSIENAVQKAIGTALEDWGTIRAWGIWDASVGGNLWFWGDIAPGVEVTEGAVMVIPVGMLQIATENET